MKNLWLVLAVLVLVLSLPGCSAKQASLGFVAAIVAFCFIGYLCAVVGELRREAPEIETFESVALRRRRREENRVYSLVKEIFGEENVTEDCMWALFAICVARCDVDEALDYPASGDAREYFDDPRYSEVIEKFREEFGEE